MAATHECPIDPVIRLLSKQWTSHILWTLGRNGPQRFGELRRAVEGISSKVLTERLRMLEEKELIYREQKDTVPPAVTYGLTDRGHQLDNLLVSMETVARGIA